MIARNNIFNIRIGQNWTGRMPNNGVKGFCEFVSVPYCVRAALCILRSYRKRGIFTIESIISTWAPPSENNTSAYISFVCERLSVSKDYKISLYHPMDCYNLLASMAKFETGFILLPSCFDEGYFLFSNVESGLFEL